MATRITNLGSSGLDIDQLVKNLMKAQSARYDKLYQLKTQLEWKKTDYNTMYTAINDFRSKTIMNYKLESTLKPKQVASSDDTKVTATANSDAVNFTHTITVADLAQSASMTSSAAISKVGSPGKTNLSDHIGVSGKIKLTISDGTTTKNLENTTDGTGYDTTGKSIYDLVSDINKLGLNVKASYDATLDRFFLSNSKTGATAQIILTSDDGTGTGVGSLAEKLQLGSSTTVTTADAPVLPEANPPVFTTGKDAVFNLDGVIGLTRSSNQFTISGVTYNLKALGAANVTVSADNEQVVTNIKAFIESYNSMLGKLNTEINEDKYKDYLPLTTEQKSEMNESDIKLWEEKAKSGLLHGNTILRDLVNKMRSAVSAPVTGLTGSYTSASSIGITTGSWQEGGKLYLNETKLREALDADPEAVNKIFGTAGSTSNASGIAVRLYDELRTASDKIVSEAGVSASSTFDLKSNLAKQIADYNRRMNDMNQRLQTQEDLYYAKFTAMEKALSQLSKQQSWLSQMGSSGS